MEKIKFADLDLNAENFDGIVENVKIEDYEYLTENYSFLPNVPRVKEILGEAAKNIIAEGKNWFIIRCDDYSCEIYEQLDNEGLFPYFSYDEHIDNFR